MHAGHRQRRGLVDRDDARRRIRACHQRDMLDARRHDIGGEIALADDEAAVLAHAAVGRDEAEFARRAHGVPALRLVQAAHALGGERDRLDDLRIAGAAADVAGDRLDDLLARRRGFFDEQRVRGEDHRRRAIAALHAVGFAERILHGRQLARPRRQPLDGGDGIAVGLHREHQAGAHRRAVDQHRAGAADAVLAAGMRAGEQSLSRRQSSRVVRGSTSTVCFSPVDVELDLHGRLAALDRRRRPREPRASTAARLR